MFFFVIEMTLFGERLLLRPIQLLKFWAKIIFISFDIVDMFLQFVQHVME